jgi:rhomboid protease GluP
MDPSGTQQPPTGPNEAQQRPVSIRFKQSRPWVTYVLIGLTAVVFLLQLLSETVLGVDILANFGVKYNQGIVAGQYWRLITPVLLHGGVFHVGLNLYALAIIGSGIERMYGPLRFLALYLIAAFAGNVFSFVFSPNPSLGASTAIFGLLGAQIVLIFNNRKLFGNRYRSVLINALGIAVLNLGIGLTPGIDNFGHLGGLAGGVLFALLGGPLWDLEGIFPTYQWVNRRPQSQEWLAAILTFGLFVAIAAITIMQRS